MEHFFTLTPERILDAVEQALSVRATGRTLALNSMENRVYEIELEERDPVVVKFYRPARWSREAILDEHHFLTELVTAEVPAIAPLGLRTGSTLGEHDEIFFALFPKVRGRLLSELSDDQLRQVGRLLARLHNVGARGDASHRPRLALDHLAGKSLATLEQAALWDPLMAVRYRHYVQQIADAIGDRLDGLEMIRIHGDCHLGNVLWREESCFFVDFDDFVIGPPVQDVWLIVRGRGPEADRQRDLLLDGYEQMREFDRTALRLIEPLRALRMIHYAAWIARRWQDPTFPRAFPDFGSARYWVEEIVDLDEQLRLIEASP